MNSEALRLVVLTASVRDGRFGPVVTRWFEGQARQRPDFDVDVVDLADYQLPLALPTPGTPLSDDTARVRDELSSRLTSGDAYVVVTPEYNHSAPAALKNILDWFLEEWAAKPVGFVSYGGLSGGLRAVEHLRQMFAELHATSVRDTVSFHTAWERFDTEGKPHAAAVVESAAKTVLDQLAWWGVALRTARTARPYQR